MQSPQGTEMKSGVRDRRAKGNCEQDKSTQGSDQSSCSARRKLA